MKNELNENTLKEAGKKLIEVGENLAEGNIDELLKTIGAGHTYPAWEELIKAKADIENAIRERDSAIEMQKMLIEVIGSVLNSVFRFRLPK